MHGLSPLLVDARTGCVAAGRASRFASRRKRQLGVMETGDVAIPARSMLCGIVLNDRRLTPASFARQPARFFADPPVAARRPPPYVGLGEKRAFSGGAPMFDARGLLDILLGGAGP